MDGGLDDGCGVDSDNTTERSDCSGGTADADAVCTSCWNADTNDWPPAEKTGTEQSAANTPRPSAYYGLNSAPQQSTPLLARGWICSPHGDEMTQLAVEAARRPGSRSQAVTLAAVIGGPRNWEDTSHVRGVRAEVNRWAFSQTPIALSPGWVNARGFGARGDGITNDTAALTAAITAACMAPAHNLYIPHGTYVLYIRA